MKKRYLLLCLLACCGLLALTGCGENPGDATAKPVLYLYPEEETTVNVQLDYTGQLTTTYPAYGDGWTVTAHPDGTLTDPATGREHYCLFWEGVSPVEYDFSEGFVVPGKETAAFLEEALATLGLTRRPTSSSSIGCLRWRATPTTSSPSRTKSTPRTPPSLSPPPPTPSSGSSWPGRGWRSRWRFRPKLSPPPPALGSPWWSGVGQKSSNRPCAGLPAVLHWGKPW